VPNRGCIKGIPWQLMPRTEAESLEADIPNEEAWLAGINVRQILITYLAKRLTRRFQEQDKIN